jgi:hypothetical protein
MWWLLHGKTRTRAVPGGQTLEERCPECRAVARFTEVEVTTAAGAFFVDVVASTRRAFKCTACGEIFDLRDDGQDDQDETVPIGPTGTPAPRPTAARDLLAQLEAEQAQRAAVAAQREVQVEDELAALKRKLGKT